MPEGPAVSRRYDSSSRQEQARRTRARVVAAARELLVQQGYEATTLARVAHTAGVSVPTIQKSFGTKAALIKAVYDVTLAGDDSPVPMAARPAFARLEAETDPHETLRLYAEIAGELWGRLGVLYPAILSGAMSGAPDLVLLRRAITEESRIGARDIVEQLARQGGLTPGLGVDEGADLLWWLIQPEQYVVMVVHAGWPLERFVAWFRENAQRLLLGSVAGN